jgi:flagellar hook-associated protein 1 FlgK
MSDILSIGTSALIAYRRALDTVSHNIANVDTEGYSRQRVEMNARRGGILQVQSYGSGVEVSGVQRLSDYFLFNRLTGEDSAYARLATFATYGAEVDAWMSDSDSGPSASLRSFFSGLQGLAQNASSSSSRQQLLYQAQTLSSTLKDYQNRFDTLDREIDGRVADSVKTINEYASQLANLNKQIAQSQSAQGSQAYNDLLDQRQNVLRDLSGQVGYTTTTTAADGSINVFVGGGQALVLGSRANELAVQNDEYSRPRSLVLKDGSGTATPVSSKLSGGELGGMLDFRREVLEPAINDLGRTAAALASAVNAQHRQGVDQYGNPGGDFFTTPTALATASSKNTGSASVDVAIGDSAQLAGSDYTLKYDGSAWSMTQIPSGDVVPLSGDGTPGNPLTGAGIELTLNGSAQAGDQFLVQPTRYAAGSLDVAITDPAKIAAAGPVTQMAATTNTGSASITASGVTDAADPNLQTPVSIQFIDANTYSINGAGAYPYTPGQPIAMNGWSMTLDGAPAAGDSFGVTPTGADSGDNSNANALAGIADLKLLDGGRSTFSVAMGNLVADVGSQTQQAQLQADAQATLRANTESSLDSISGVNLDEEAADLSRYQQAYEAAAQVISVAGSLFDTLLSAMR